MSFNVIFYTFDKKINSTKQPVSGTTPSRTLSCVLKDDCSIMSPTITIQRLSDDENPEVYNYCHIAKFRRYYFVNDWTWENGIWMAHLSLDTLASWKTNIGSMNEYILRASGNATGQTSSFFNGAITDTKYPATTNFSVVRQSVPNLFVDDISGGCYVVGCISSESTNAVGAVSYYAMSSTEFGDFKEFLFSDSFITEMELDSSEEISAELLKTLFNPYQYIVSCTWFPFPKTAISGTSVSDVPLGWWHTHKSGKRISDMDVNLSTYAQMPSHPQYLSRGSYLNHSPYSRYTLHYAPFGMTAIDRSYFGDYDYLVINIDIDLITGLGVLILKSNSTASQQNSKFVTMKKTMVGVPIQIAQLGVDYLGGAVSLIDTAKDFISGAKSGAVTGAIAGGVLGAGGIAVGTAAGAVVGGIINGAEGIYSTINTLMPQMQTSGSNGTLTEYYSQMPEIIGQFFYLVDENLSHTGRPLCKQRTISTLSGYMVCSDADISFPCLLEEKKLIHDHMTSGFFYE